MLRKSDKVDKDARILFWKHHNKETFFLSDYSVLDFDYIKVDKGEILFLFDYNYFIESFPAGYYKIDQYTDLKYLWMRKFISINWDTVDKPLINLKGILEYCITNPKVFFNSIDIDLTTLHEAMNLKLIKFMKSITDDIINKYNINDENYHLIDVDEIILKNSQDRGEDIGISVRSNDITHYMVFSNTDLELQ